MSKKDPGDLPELLSKENINQWMKTIDIRITYFDLLNVLGNLILALKHPGNTGPSSKILKKIGRQFADAIIDNVPDIPQALVTEWKESLK